MHEDPAARANAGALARELLGSQEMRPTEEASVGGAADKGPASNACCITVAAFQRSPEGRSAQGRVNAAARELAEAADMVANADVSDAGKESPSTWKLRALHLRPGRWVMGRQNVSMDGAPGARGSGGCKGERCVVFHGSRAGRLVAGRGGRRRHPRGSALVAEGPSQRYGPSYGWCVRRNTTRCHRRRRCVQVKRRSRPLQATGKR